MPPIRLLETNVIDQIAAGEVVVRPASALKELIENSLDAGSSAIDVEVEQSGFRRLSVRDDGTGIPSDELTLALTRHATSKLDHWQDLYALRSFGFRGEALASLSAISRFTLSSRTPHSTHGYTISAEGGVLTTNAAQLRSQPVGTEVLAEDLFYNTPARKKFLRSPQYEWRALLQVFKQFAVSHPNVYFRLSHNRKVVQAYPSLPRTTQGQLQRIEVVFGRLTAVPFLSVVASEEHYALQAWLRPSNGELLCFVNRRAVKDRVIMHAVKLAYAERAGALESGLPSGVLFLSLPASELDINVHPCKEEVRFADSNGVHKFIYRSILKGLIHSAALHTSETEASALTLGNAESASAGSTSSTLNLVASSPTISSLPHSAQRICNPLTSAAAISPSDGRLEARLAQWGTYNAGLETPLSRPSSLTHIPLTSEAPCLGSALSVLKGRYLLTQNDEDTLFIYDLGQLNRKLSAQLWPIDQPPKRYALKERYLLPLNPTHLTAEIEENLSTFVEFVREGDQAYITHLPVVAKGKEKVCLSALQESILQGEWLQRHHWLSWLENSVFSLSTAIILLQKLKAIPTLLQPNALNAMRYRLEAKTWLAHLTTSVSED